MAESQPTAGPDAKPGDAPYKLLKSEADAMRLCETFLDDVMAGRYEHAFAVVRPHFPITEERFQHLKQETQRQHGLAELPFGKPIGHVLVESQSVHETALRYRFVEKFDLDLVYWDFVFYQPREGWLLNGVGFDDQVESLFGGRS